MNDPESMRCMLLLCKFKVLRWLNPLNDPFAIIDMLFFSSLSILVRLCNSLNKSCFVADKWLDERSKVSSAFNPQNNFWSTTDNLFAWSHSFFRLYSPTNDPVSILKMLLLPRCSLSSLANPGNVPFVMTEILLYPRLKWRRLVRQVNVPFSMVAILLLWRVKNWSASSPVNDHFLTAVILLLVRNNCSSQWSPVNDPFLMWEILLFQVTRMWDIWIVWRFQQECLSNSCGQPLFL